MSHVFLSYASSDQGRVEPLVHALLAEGLPVWWDRTIPPGRTWHEVVEEALTRADCVVVVWTKESVRSDWVRAEAEEGLRRRILVPVLLDNAKIPFEFRRIQAAKLVDWAPGARNREYDKLKVAIERLLKNPSQEPRTEPDPEDPSRQRPHHETTRPMDDAGSPVRPSRPATLRSSRQRWLAGSQIAVALMLIGSTLWWFRGMAKPSVAPDGSSAMTSGAEPSPIIDPSEAGAPSREQVASRSGTEEHAPPTMPTADPIATPAPGEPRSTEEVAAGDRSNLEPPPRADNPQALALVRAILAASQANGGIGRESEIAEAKRRIDEVRETLGSSIERGDRGRAQQLNKDALSLLRSERATEALQVFEKAYDADPADIEIRNNLGYALMKTGDLARAERELLGVLSVRPDRVSAWANLGHAYALKGMPSEAVASLANAYRFSASPVKTRAFLRQLAAEDEDARVRAAASQTLSLRLITQAIPEVRTGAVDSSAERPQAAEAVTGEPPESGVAVFHRHGIGSCRGSLVLSADGLRYETSKTDDAFRIPLSSIREIETDHVKKTLRLRLHRGRTYNFGSTADNTDAFLRFQQELSRSLSRIDQKKR